MRRGIDFEAMANARALLMTLRELIPVSFCSIGSKRQSTEKELAMNRIFWIASILFLFAGLMLMYGCAGMSVTVGDSPEGATRDVVRHNGRAVGNGNGPPPWAPAHGYRAKHRYRYYPSSQIYFDEGREIYFYYDNGQWRTTVRLPGRIRAQLGEAVTLEMDTDQPYEYHGQVLKRYHSGK